MTTAISDLWGLHILAELAELQMNDPIRSFEHRAKFRLSFAPCALFTKYMRSRNNSQDDVQSVM